MNKIIKYFIDNPLLVNVFTLLIIIIGIMSIYSLQKETFPPVDFDIVIVQTVYPGASAEDVEKLVTLSLERKIKSVDGIKNLNAMSAESNSILYIELEPKINVDKFLSDLNTAVDQVTDFPDEVKRPIVKSINNKRRGMIRVTLTGKNYLEIRNYAKHMRDYLEEQKELSGIVLEGYLSDQIEIDIDLEKMNSKDVTIEEVSQAIRSRNIDLSAGKIKKDSGDIIIRTLSGFKTLSDIKNVVVRSNPSGSKILVKDIALVKRSLKDSDIRQRSNGKPAIFLKIMSKEKADVLKATKKLKDNVSNYLKNHHHSNIKQYYTDDYSYYVKRRLNILTSNGKIGFLLVFLSLMLFLNFKTSLMTSLGAPIAFMISFACMEYMGVTINLISMFALILVLGMLVDDSIIVAEQFYQNLENDMPPKEAALEAAKSTFVPVIGTVLTTIVAFGSLFFMGGIMGKFLWPVPMVVIICLLGSFLECFFILPSHLAEYCKLNTKKTNDKHWYDPFFKLYSNTLRRSLKFSKTIILLFILTFIASIFAATKMKFELFPGDDVRIAFVQIKGTVGDSLQKTDLSMKSLEKIASDVLRKDEVKQIRAQVGMLVGSHQVKTGSHYGSLILYLTPPSERKRSTNEIISIIEKKARASLPDYSIVLKKVQGGPPVGKAVEINITGNNLENLKLAAKDVYDLIDKDDSIQGPQIDFEVGKKQMIINVNEIEAKRLQLDTSMIASALRNYFSDDAVTSIRESDEDIDIVVHLSRKYRSDQNTLKHLFVLNKQRKRIPLSSVVKISYRPGAFIIRRLNRKRIISISADIDKRKTTPLRIAKKLSPKIANIFTKYKDLNYEIAGENKDTRESMSSLVRSSLISIFVIFIILLIIFSNIRHCLIVMSAIPLGLTGVIITFLVTGTSLGFMAAMGVVALIGVVVNDSIVLVAFINEKIKKLEKNNESYDLVDVIWSSALARFRPIILTTITTFAGLLPIAHFAVAKFFSFGNKVDPDPFLQPMALSFAWGLLFATFITLILVPCLYLVIENTREKIIIIYNKRFKILNKV